MQSQLDPDDHQYDLHELVQSLDGIVWEAFYPPLRFTFVNEYAYDLLGYATEQWYAEPDFLLRITHPADRERVAQIWQSVDAHQSSQVIEFRAVTRDGTMLWLHCRLRCISDPEYPVRVLRGVMLDITAQKQAESRLRASEQKFRSLVASSPDILAILDLTTNTIAYLNRDVFLGYPFDAIADLYQFLHIVHPEDRELLIANWWSTATSDQTTTEYRLRPYNQGRWEWLRSRNSVLKRDAWGAPIQVLATLSIITEHKQNEDELRHRAQHDPLTDLPNRLLFLERLEQMLMRAQQQPDLSWAVLYLDLDRFKVVNDSLGHIAGDQLLITIAARLQACLRVDDTVARLGGDEFAIMLHSVPQMEDATRTAMRIQRVLAEPVMLDGHEIVPHTSIGIVLGAPHYTEAKAVLRDADTALYQAKEAGRDCYRIFDSDMHTQALARLQGEVELRRAIEHTELRVYYQPLVRLDTRQISGFEALVRWQHPERGLLTPADFLPLAVETGQIIPLGRWVFQEVCQQIAIWRQHAPPGLPLTVHVNIASKEMFHSDLLDSLSDTLQQVDLGAFQITFELTERIIYDYGDAMIDIVYRLRDLGIQLCIDGFGPGASSLSYLQRLPIQSLEIAHSLTQTLLTDQESRGIIQLIIALSRTLGCTVIAEGVESTEQATVLELLGCDYAQGFLFGKPITSPAVANLLRNIPHSPIE